MMFARFLNKRKAKRRGTNGTVNEECEESSLGPRQRENLALVQRALAIIDANHSSAAGSFKELFVRNADINFSDTHMNLTDIELEVKALKASFPDLTARWDDMVALTERDLVVVSGFVLSGTHTGEPYAFGPFPSVPMNGAFCENDPERIVFWIHSDSGKIKRVDVRSSSEKTGPQGFYRQLGGFPL